MHHLGMAGHVNTSGQPHRDQRLFSKGFTHLQPVSNRIHQHAHALALDKTLGYGGLRRGMNQAAWGVMYE